MNRDKNGCEYGRMNREFINEIKEDILEIKENTQHFSKRLPEWATILIAVLVGIIGYAIRGIL